MIGRIKVSALALVALAAIGAVSASAAQAGEFTAEKYPATITGTDLTDHVFKFNMFTVTCKEAAFHGELAEASSELTLDATYGICKTNNGKAVEINMTSCDYQLHAGETMAMDKVDGSLDVKCAEAEDAIDFVVPFNGCKAEILAQNGLNSLTYTDNTMAEDFDVDISLNGVLYKQNANCPGGAMMSFAEYDGKSTIQADFEEEEVGTIVH
jgi:hypothetical protein